MPKCQELGLVGSKSVDNALFFGDFISHGFLRRSLLDSFGNQPDRHASNEADTLLLENPNNKDVIFDYIKGDDLNNNSPFAHFF